MPKIIIFYPSLYNFLCDKETDIFYTEIMELANTEWEKFKENNALNYEALFAIKDSYGYSIIKDALSRGLDYTNGNPNFYEEVIKHMFIKQEKFKLQILQKNELDIDEFKQLSRELNKYNF